MEIEEIIQSFNDGELDVENYFGNIDNFFTFLKKRGVLSQIDPDAQDSEDWQNKFLIWLYNNDESKFYQYVEKALNDVEFVNGNPYLVVDNRGEFAKLFCRDSRNDISQDTIEAILDGENDWGYYGDTTDDVYRDVIEELTKENLLRLKEYIVNTLNGVQIDPDTELLDSIAKSQGSEYATIDQSNIDEVVDDKETMDILMRDELSELKSELYSVHSSAYNSAYEDEVYDYVWSKLETYFDGNGEWITRPHTYKKDTEVQKFRIPIHNFDSYILDYLDSGKEYGSSGMLYYHGEYLGMLAEEDCLRVYPPDYPDFRKVDKLINEYFRDYI